ncbi:MAG: glycosyltransferase [Trueperaceae bacterium]
MKLAIIALPFAKLEPNFQEYGGTERPLTALIEGLRNRGHQVILFAAEGSSFPGVDVVSFFEPVEFIAGAYEHTQKSVCHSSLAHQWLKENNITPDVINDHNQGADVFGSCSCAPLVVSHHNGHDLDQWTAPYFPHVTHIVHSQSEKRFMQELGVNDPQLVYLDVPVEPLIQGSQGLTKQGYVAFIGRFHEHKRPDVAIRAAIQANMPIKIAASPNVPVEQQAWFAQEVKPYFDHPLVEYVKLITEDRKARFLGEALAVITPNTDRPEPFGLTSVEANACGTPVITVNLGATPEIIWPEGAPPAGIVIERGSDDVVVSQMAEAIRQIRSGEVAFASNTCWENARRFGQGMVAGYEAVFEQAIARWQS